MALPPPYSVIGRGKSTIRAAFSEEVGLLSLGYEMIKRLETSRSHLEYSIDNGYSQRTRGFVATS